MDYIYQYNVAAFCVTALVLFYFLLKKRISTRFSNTFLVLTIDLLVAIVTDLVTIWTIANPYKVPLWVNYVLNMICMFSYTALPVIFYFCIFTATTSAKKKFLIPEKHWLLIPAAIGLLLILLTPFTDFLIYFDENRIYHTGNLFYTLSLIGFAYLVMVIIRTVRKRYKLTRLQIITIIVYTTGSIVTVIVEAIDNRILIPLFFGSLTAVLIYLSLDNPSDYIDSVTNIYNKKAFFVILNGKFVHNKSFKLICFQIENIASLNSTLGYENFNRILLILKNNLKELVCEKRMFRVSGSKFVVLVEPDEDFDAILQGIKTKLDQPVCGYNINVTINYKLTYINCPKDAASSDGTFDLLCHTLEAPTTLPGTISMADSRLLEKAKRETKLLELMKEAIQTNKFYVVYQPVYSVKTKKYSSAEALVRINNSDLGFISPEEFIPIAERNGLMPDIGKNIFTQVCEFLTLNKVWEQGIEYISINLSVIQCMKEELQESLIKIMDSYNLPYKYIHFEVTEDAATISSDTLRKHMHNLMEKQIYFALDDNGINLQAATNLLQYPFKTFKLDKTLVWNAMKDENSLKIIQHTIALLKDMGIEIVAEGIESEEMAKTLEKLNCDYFQGFYYSKPLQDNAFVELITK